LLLFSRVHQALVLLIFTVCPALDDAVHQLITQARLIA
jgi:hypothetical protein